MRIESKSFGTRDSWWQRDLLEGLKRGDKRMRCEETEQKAEDEDSMCFQHSDSSIYHNEAEQVSFVYAYTHESPI